MSSAVRREAAPRIDARQLALIAAGDPRWRLRAATGAAQLLYAAQRLRRRGDGWYHVALGSRQVAQAWLNRSGALPPAADRAIDGLHVATMAAVALVRPRRRQAALLGTAHAATWFLLDHAIARRAPAPGTAPAVPSAAE